ncbi:MAG: hypothetical protein OQJ89_11915 [Kangiellaceae bacterium]|nr:hypothetical protein [Kangiellaceae bacterium]MCW9017666.1 hypothetical protein [Kangiellaceae bacterium]
MTKQPTEIKKDMMSQKTKLASNISAHTVSPKQIREAQIKQKKLIEKDYPFEEHGL